MFMVGAAPLIAGSFIRLWCYRTMGRQFTHEVSILRDHHLVATGPYAYIRHPAYTASFMMLFSSTVLLFCWDGWFRTCDMGSTRLVWLVHVWDIVAPYVAYALYKRAPVEDEQLQKHFGKEWEAYRLRVPYKFVPYVM